MIFKNIYLNKRKKSEKYKDIYFYIYFKKYINYTNYKNDLK